MYVKSRYIGRRYTRGKYIGGRYIRSRFVENFTCSVFINHCVEIVDGLFHGYYAVITWAPVSETMNDHDEVEIQFLTLKHGKYVLSNHDYDSRPLKELKKVKFELDSRLRYTIL